VSDIRDRIVDFRRVPAKDLKPHPDNWRTHPPEQVQAFRGLLDQIGFAGAAVGVVRRKKVMLLDGHLRKDEVDPDFAMPVLITDLTDDEIPVFLATFDPVSAMATMNPARLSALLALAEAKNDRVKVLLDQLADDAASRERRHFENPDAFPELDPDAMDLTNTCPRCGFEFD
jgi:hypothetical protein